LISIVAGLVRLGGPFLTACIATNCFVHRGSTLSFVSKATRWAPRGPKHRTKTWPALGAAPPPRYHIRLVLCQQSDSRPHVCLYDSLAPCRHKSLVAGAFRKAQSTPSKPGGVIMMPASLPAMRPGGWEPVSSSYQSRDPPSPINFLVIQNPGVSERIYSISFDRQRLPTEVC